MTLSVLDFGREPCQGPLSAAPRTLDLHNAAGLEERNRPLEGQFISHVQLLAAPGVTIAVGWLVADAARPRPRLLMLCCGGRAFVGLWVVCVLPLDSKLSSRSKEQPSHGSPPHPAEPRAMACHTRAATLLTCNTSRRMHGLVRLDT